MSYAGLTKGTTDKYVKMARRIVEGVAVKMAVVAPTTKEELAVIKMPLW